MKLRSGNYSTSIWIYLEDDTEVLITEVYFYEGCSQSETSPAEPAYVEILDAEYENGETANDEDLSYVNMDEIEEEFHKEQGGMY